MTLNEINMRSLSKPDPLSFALSPTGSQNESERKDMEKEKEKGGFNGLQEKKEYKRDSEKKKELS